MDRLARVVAEFAARPPVVVDDPSRPQAAVALVVVPDPDRVLLIRRAERAGDPWSGQLALPGGRRDATDLDLLHTAIRETEEETGLVLPRERHRATLDDLAPVTPVLPPILVRPHLFHLEFAGAVGLSDEVAHAAWVELAALADPGTYRDTAIEVRGAPRTVPGYHLPEGFLWGMTERILTPVIRAWRDLGG